MENKKSYIIILLILIFAIVGCANPENNKEGLHEDDDDLDEEIMPKKIHNITRIQGYDGRGIDLGESIWIDGKEAYRGLVDGKERIVFDGEVVSEGLYDGFRGQLKELNGQPVFGAYRLTGAKFDCYGSIGSRNELFIVYNNSRIGEGDFHSAYCKDTTTEIYFEVVDDKIAYLKNSEYPDRIVFDGKEIGNNTYSVEFPIEINGKLAYPVSVSLGDSYKLFLVYDGQEIGKQYRHARKILEIREDFAYIASNDKNEWKDSFLVYKDKEYPCEDGAFCTDVLKTFGCRYENVKVVCT